MTTTKPFALGSVSTGTLRTEDLLDAYETYLEAHNVRITVPGDGLSDGGDMYTMDELLAIAVDHMEKQCPPFVYFGVHPGDADFGFWPDWDGLNDQIGGYVLNTDYQFGEYIVRFHGEDVTCMDLNRNILWSTAS